uniref:Uncharacterized protein n=1 Tax=Phocoena sinus TaxID=42100 RepID=A0A8C9ATM9_PHOSS
MSIVVPFKALHRAEGHVRTGETNTSKVYKGKLIEVKHIQRLCLVAQLEQVYIHGSKICLPILPDMLKNAPMLKNMKNTNQGSGAGQGKTAILKAQVAMRRRERKRIWKYLPEAKTILSLEWNFALIFACRGNIFSFFFLFFLLDVYEKMDVS